MSYVYWAITGQYSIINDPITGFVNTSRFTTLVCTFCVNVGRHGNTSLTSLVIRLMAAPLDSSLMVETWQS